MITTQFLNDKKLPLVVEPDVAAGGETTPQFLSTWYNNNQTFIDENLHQYGAILFRNFQVNQPAIFEEFVHTVSKHLMDYVDGNSPRTKLSSGVYTSTEYPAEYPISLHNELSYSEKWPSRLFFCCITAPQEGGETPLVDSRTLLQKLSLPVVEAFKQKQVKYIRNLNNGRGFGPSWQQTFETTEKEAVEAHCREAGFNFIWKENGGLQVSHIRPATATHPQTDEEVWFNQADQFHPSTHPKAIYDSLTMLYKGKDDEMPQYARFGDDSKIEAGMLDEVREVTKDEMVLFPWQEGDLIVVDNMLVSHGRMPFSGPRKILVAMSPF